MSRKLLQTITLMLLVLPAAAFAQNGASGKSFVQAASEERLFTVTVYSAKPEKWSEALQFIKNEIVPAHSKGGRKHMEVWTSDFGQGFEAWFITPLENFAARDKPGEVLLKGLGSREAVAAFANKWNSLINGSHRFVIRVRPDLSYIKPNAPTPRLAYFNTVEVAYGRRSEYDQWVKAEILPNQRKAGDYGQLRTLIHGTGAAFSSLTIEPYENFAALDKPSGTEKALGREAMAKVQAKMQGVVTRIERRVLLFRPDLSILPK